jgi:hypothetical protein
LDQQLQAMKQAQTFFGDQLLMLAEREGKSGEDLNSDIARVRAEHADLAESAQIALACLRRLQEQA